MRDVAHKQISESTSQELITRRADIRRRALELNGMRLYKLAALDELRGIESDLYCRANGIESNASITYALPICEHCGLDREAVEMAARALGLSSAALLPPGSCEYPGTGDAPICCEVDPERGRA